MLSNPTLPTILFVIGVLIFVLAVVAFRENPRRTINRVTGIMLLFAALGAMYNGITPAFLHIIPTDQAADFGLRFSLLWELVFPLLFYFSLLFPRKNDLLRKHSHGIHLLLALYLVRFFLVLAFPSADHIDSFFALKPADGLWGALLRPVAILVTIIKSIIGFFYRYHPPLFIVLDILCVAGAVGFMVRGYLKLPDPLTRRRVRLVITGIGLSALSFGTANVLPHLNNEMTTLKASYLLFLLASMLLAISLGVAIYKYQFLNTRMIIRRGLVSSLAAVILAGLFLLLYGQTRRVLAPLMDTEVPVLEILFLLIAVFFLQPFIGTLNGLIDKLLQPEQLNKEQLDTLSREILSVVHIDAISSTIIPQIGQLVGVRSVHLFVLANGKYLSVGSEQEPQFSGAGELIRMMREALSAFSVDQVRVQITSEEELGALDRLDPRVILPVKNRQSLLGILFLSSKTNGEPYLAREIESLELLALQLGIALENIRLYQIAKSQQTLQEELSVASRIQRMLLPLQPPSGFSFRVASLSIPSKEVGGDYHDFIELPNRHIGIAIGDIAGKGIPGAILMANLQASLRAYAPSHDDPAAVVTEVNRLLTRTTAPEKYATFLYAIFDPVALTLQLCNAGHNYPILMRGDGSCEIISKSNPIIGVDETIRFKGTTCQLAPNDLLVFYSDGITEALNNHFEEYGQDRLMAFLHKHRHLEVQKIKNKVYDDVIAFAQETSHWDDITFVALAIQPAAAGLESRECNENK